jgi:hypothetical protein
MQENVPDREDIAAEQYSTVQYSTVQYSTVQCTFAHLGLCEAEWGLESRSSNRPSSFVISSSERRAE